MTTRITRKSCFLHRRMTRSRDIRTVSVRRALHRFSDHSWHAATSSRSTRTELATLFQTHSLGDAAATFCPRLPSLGIGLTGHTPRLKVPIVSNDPTRASFVNRKEKNKKTIRSRRRHEHAYWWGGTCILVVGISAVQLCPTLLRICYLQCCSPREPGG